MKLRPFMFPCLMVSVLGCTTATTLKVDKLKSDSNVAQGIPFSLTKPQFLVTEKPSEENATIATYELAMAYVPDLDHQYTVRLESPTLVEADFGLTIESKGHIASVSGASREQVTPTVTAIGDFIATAIGIVAKAAADTNTQLGRILDRINIYENIFLKIVEECPENSKDSPCIVPYASIPASDNQAKPLQDLDKEIKIYEKTRDFVSDFYNVKGDERAWLETGKNRATQARQCAENKVTSVSKNGNYVKKDGSDCFKKSDKSLKKTIMDFQNAYIAEYGKSEEVRVFDWMNKLGKAIKEGTVQPLKQLRSQVEKAIAVDKQTDTAPKQNPETVGEVTPSAKNGLLGDLDPSRDFVSSTVNNGHSSESDSSAKTGSLSEVVKILFDDAEKRVNIVKLSKQDESLMASVLDLNLNQWRHLHASCIERKMIAIQSRLLKDQATEPKRHRCSVGEAEPSELSEKLEALKKEWGETIDAASLIAREKPLEEFLKRSLPAAQPGNVNNPVVKNYEIARLELKEIRIEIKEKRDAIRPKEKKIEKKKMAIDPWWRQQSGKINAEEIISEYKEENGKDPGDFILVIEKGYQ